MEYTEESIFNMALAYLKRIDKLFYFANICSMNANVYGWNNILNSLFRELVIRLTPDEIEELKGKDKDIKDIIDNLDANINFKSVNKICNNNKYIRQYRKQALYLLSELEMKIRIKMQKKGMLLPSKDDPRRAITQR